MNGAQGHGGSITKTNRCTMDFSDEPSTATETRSGSTKGLPWRGFAFAIAIGFGLSILIAFIQWMQSDAARWFFIGLDGLQTYVGLAVLSLGVIATAVFMGWCSRRFATGLIIACISTIVIASQLVRIDSFRGDRTPRFAWRWLPTTEERLRSYFTAHREQPKRDHAAGRMQLHSHGADFCGLLGTDRTGSLVGRSLSKQWERHPPRQLWAHPVGLGWSSFAGAGDFAVTMEQRDDRECMVAYHARTGEELWQAATFARFTSEHGDGPRSTPLIVGERVIGCGATGNVRCVDLITGNVLWEYNVFREASEAPPHFGWVCSPIQIGNMLLVTPGGASSGALLCLDLESGNELWRAGTAPASYASPIVSTLCGTLQILVFHGEGLEAFDTTGHSLWFFPWRTQGDSMVNVAPPVVIDRGDILDGSYARVAITSGYDMGTALLSISKSEGGWNATAQWTSKQLKSKFSNVVAYKDHLYGLDNGILTCLRLSDGSRVWKQGRYGHGQILRVDQFLLVQCESGEIALVEATPNPPNELGRFRALEDKTWNHAALIDNILLVRNDHESAAYLLPTVLRID